MEFSFEQRSDEVVLVGPTRIPVEDGSSLWVELEFPEHAYGLVVLMEGDGPAGDRWACRSIARLLRDAHLATLITDLSATFDHWENKLGARGENLEILADRVAIIGRWLGTKPETQYLPLGYFGFRSSVAAAFLAAALDPINVAAIVSGGGRPDLASGVLGRLEVPTLLLVEGNDRLSVGANSDALQDLTVEKMMAILPTRKPRFNGLREWTEVARLASQWFARHMQYYG